ncbi:perlucin isoform X1 [Magallana gigas]|uniref:perlucin isoform X1 n=1 Tax=Magallana gigas TaxID=29159 RepID=UPI00334183E6
MEKGLVVVLFSTIAAGCRNGWTVNKNSCYHVSRDTASWVEATRMCELHGGYLVRVESAEEQSFVQNLIQGLHARQYWLGGSDWTTEGAWVWEPYGQSINYTNWLHGQPDNSHNAEHCLMVDRHFHFKWLDSDCHTALHYICEDPEVVRPTSDEVIG